jgi:hypothetical protein
MAMKIIQRFALLAAVVIATACASTLPEGAQAGRNPNLISLEEIQASTATNLHDLVSSARPAWLRTRSGVGGSAGPDEGVMIYLNQSRMGGIGELRQMELAGVTSLTFVDPAAATQRWGTGHARGAIVVSTSPVR